MESPRNFSRSFVVPMFCGPSPLHLVGDLLYEQYSRADNFGDHWACYLVAGY